MSFDPAKADPVMPTEEEMAISDEAIEHIMSEEMAPKFNFMIDLCAVAAEASNIEALGHALSALMIFSFNAGRKYED